MKLEMSGDPPVASQRAGRRGARPGTGKRLSGHPGEQGCGCRPWREGNSLRRMEEGFDLVTIAQGHPFSLPSAPRFLRLKAPPPSPDQKTQLPGLPSPRPPASWSQLPAQTPHVGSGQPGRTVISGASPGLCRTSHGHPAAAPLFAALPPRPPAPLQPVSLARAT